MTGQDLIDRANFRMAGYQNSVDSLALLDFLNEACSEVWAVLKSEKADYFVQFSQFTNPTGNYYFPPLIPGTREYPLPADFREIRFVEVATPGVADTAFVFCSPVDEAFRAARRGGNAGGVTANAAAATFLYTIVGANTFSLGDYLPQQLNVILWYTRAIPTFEPQDPLPDILTPYINKAVDYAVKKVMLVNQDSSQFTLWSQEWKQDLIMIAQGATPRNQADPVFVQGLDE